ncbi:MAG: archease [Candidatus Bipolaricaulota bacterium]|nr:archease [Candidatus Bipolaricaulota bacterium]
MAVPEVSVPYEILDHTADAGVRGIGPTVEEAFAEAALGMFSLMADLDSVRPETEVPVEVQADSLEELLVAWLGELLRERDVRGMLFSRFAVRIAERDGRLHLSGRAWGEGIDPGRHRLGVEVKAATYAGVRVEQRGGGWIAQCVVDL